MGQVKQAVMDAGLSLAGGAAARTVSKLVPLPDTGLTGIAKGIAAALAVGMGARKFLGGDKARFVMAGAMQVPLKALIVQYLPSAAAYLGEYEMFQAYPGAVDGYLDSVGNPSGIGAMDSEEEFAGIYD